MRLILFLTILLGLNGCGAHVTVNPDIVRKLLEICDKNGGVEELNFYSYDDSSAHLKTFIICKDEAMFKVRVDD